MVFVWQGFLFLVALVFLVVASYNDLKWREVPDWLSYGLIFSGLGLRFIFSLDGFFEGGWMIFLNGFLGFLVCFGIAYLLYQVNWWGGGDSKLLMGMGSVIGLGISLGGGRGSISGSFFGWFGGFDFSLVGFFLGLFIFGAIIGVVWSAVLALRKGKEFGRKFSKLLVSVKGWHILAWVGSFGFLGLSFYFSSFWPLVVFPIGSFYLLCLVKVVEQCCFVREVGIKELVEGDWLAKDVVVGKEQIAFKGRGLEKNEIRALRGLLGEGKLETVWVKEGIPFVPSFLVAYLGLLAFKFWF